MQVNLVELSKRIEKRQTWSPGEVMALLVGVKMTLKDNFKEAIKSWLPKRWDWPADRTVIDVVDWREDPGWGGGCDTCGYGGDETEVEVDYLDIDGNSYTYHYTGTFGELLTELLAE